jgi:hypothetical protein
MGLVQGSEFKVQDSKFEVQSFIAAFKITGARRA